MLRDLLEKPFQRELNEGEHTATLNTIQFKESTKGAESDYMAANFTIDNDMNYNRNLFEKDLSIFLSHVRKQLNRQNETLDVKAFLNELIHNKIEFKLWVQYKTVPTRDTVIDPATGKEQALMKRVQNILFQAPLAPTDVAVADSGNAADELMDS